MPHHLGKNKNTGQLATRLCLIRVKDKAFCGAFKITNDYLPYPLERNCTPWKVKILTRLVLCIAYILVGFTGLRVNYQAVDARLTYTPIAAVS